MVLIREEAEGDNTPEASNGNGAGQAGEAPGSNGGNGAAAGPALVTSSWDDTRA